MIESTTTLGNNVEFCRLHMQLAAEKQKRWAAETSLWEYAVKDAEAKLKAAFDGNTHKELPK